jgi:hypothetical protein
VPSSEQMANTVACVEVAGAHVRKAAYRRAESDFSRLSIGGRKSREAGLPPPLARKSVKPKLVSAAERRCQVRNTQRTA